MRKADLGLCCACQAMESVEEATSPSEKADLLEIAQTWFDLANNHAETRKDGRIHECPLVAISGHTVLWSTCPLQGPEHVRDT